MMRSDEIMVALVDKPPTGMRPREHYIFICDRTVEAINELIRLLGNYAGNPELAFSWYDAARVAHDLRYERDLLK